MSISCDCKAAPRVYDYGNSEADYNVDARTKINDQEYLNDNTIDYFELPYCQSIGEEAFRSSSIKSISVPECKIIKKNAFRDTVSWEAESFNDFSNVVEIEYGAFQGINNTNQGAAKYIYVDFNNVEKIGEDALAGAICVSYGDDYYTFELPKLKILGKECFRVGYSNYSRVFSYINLPSIEKLEDMCFARTSMTGAFEFHLGPNCSVIGSNIFWDRYIHSPYVSCDFYLEAITPPSLAGEFDSSNHLIPNHIYVPAESVEAYKSASVWSTYASVISAIPT